MSRGVRVHRANDDLQLTVNSSLLLRVGGGDREVAGTLAVETHVFSKGLGECDLMTLSNKVAEGESITGSVARRKALVSHIEEGEELPFLHDVGDNSPLLGCGINTSRVVSTGMEKDD